MDEVSKTAAPQAPDPATAWPASEQTSPQAEEPAEVGVDGSAVAADGADAGQDPVPGSEPTAEPDSGPPDRSPEGLAADAHAAPEELVRLGAERRRQNQSVRVQLRGGAASAVDVAASSVDAGMVGGTINNHYYARESMARIGAHAGGVTADRVVSEVELYVKIRQYSDIMETLSTHGVVFLMGAARSGREATALNVLAELVGPDQIRSVYLDEGASISAVLEHAELPRKGHGHFLRIGPNHPVDSATLAAVGGRFHDADAFLVAIGPPARRVDDDLRPYAVGHDAPAGDQVLERHLLAQLRRRRMPCVGDCGTCGGGCFVSYVRRCIEDADIAAYLGRRPLPGDVVNLARQLVENAVEGREPAAALDLIGSRLRQLAAKILTPDPDSEPVHELRRTAYRIAYATFDGSPLSVVSDAASRLFDALSTPSPDGEPPAAGEAFEGRLGSLLHEDMYYAAGPGGAADAERKARLLDPALASAILDVAWNDYDRNREPMLGWLWSLGGDRRDRVRIRAAYSAGLLATYDFGIVYHSLIRRWAASERALFRQSAAMALEFAAEDSAYTGRVRRQVRDWALAANPYLNDSAARAYATDLGRLFFDDVLTNLRFIADEAVQTGSHAIAQAVNSVFEADTAALVVEALSGWVQEESRSLRVQAAKALLFLTFRRADKPADVWPALLLLAGHDAAARKRLVVLWRHALSEAIIAMGAWDALRLWGVRVDPHVEPGRVYVDLAAEALSAEPLRSRALLFYLPMWRAKHPDLTVFHTLEDAIRKA
ncbi:MAG TPA: hypothetical protein VFM37_10895 [Pseudonocardiaceae bacterium]|nr:hypothetical protein [Pseudonocardiaceae bacterium]